MLMPRIHRRGTERIPASRPLRVFAAEGIPSRSEQLNRPAAERRRANDRRRRQIPVARDRRQGDRRREAGSQPNEHPHKSSSTQVRQRRQRLSYRRRGVYPRSLAPAFNQQRSALLRQRLEAMSKITASPAPQEGTQARRQNHKAEVNEFLQNSKNQNQLGDSRSGGFIDEDV